MRTRFVTGPKTAGVDKLKKGNRINVMLIESNTLFRQGISKILRNSPDIAVVAEYADVDEAVALGVQRTPVDVILVDGDSFTSDPGRQIATLNTWAPGGKIVLLTGEGSPRLLTSTLRAGIVAYVCKDTTADELVTTIRSIVTRNDHVIISVSRADSRRLYADEDALLSTREREILALVGRGYQNGDISRRLHITVGTVKRHLTNIYAKLQAESRTDAVNKSLEMGILQLDHIVSQHKYRRSG